MKKIRESIHKYLQPIAQKGIISLQGTRFHIYIPYIYIPYMESRKMVLLNLLARYQWGNKYREQTYGHGKKGGKGEMYGEDHGNSHHHV